MAVKSGYLSPDISALAAANMMAFSPGVVDQDSVACRGCARPADLSLRSRHRLAPTPRASARRNVAEGAGPQRPGPLRRSRHRTPAPVRLLDDIGFEIGAGEALAIIGESGLGQEPDQPRHPRAAGAGIAGLEAGVILFRRDVGGERLDLAAAERADAARRSGGLASA